MKHFSKITAAILAGTLIFSGCAASENNSTEAPASNSASSNSPAPTDFKSAGCFRSAKWGMTMSEVMEIEPSLSEMSEEKRKHYADNGNTYLVGSFSYDNVTLETKYCFKDAALRKISILFNIPEGYSEEDIVKLYNSVSNEISETNGSGTETMKKKEDNYKPGLSKEENEQLTKYDPEKEYTTTWDTSDAKIELMRVYRSEYTIDEITVPARQSVFLYYTDASVS